MAIVHAVWTPKLELEKPLQPAFPQGKSINNGLFQYATIVLGLSSFAITSELVDFDEFGLAPEGGAGVCYPLKWVVSSGLRVIVET